MQKWEYLVRAMKDEPSGTAAMNELGDEGWELIAITHGPLERDWVCRYYYYFKRPKT